MYIIYPTKFKQTQVTGVSMHIIYYFFMLYDEAGRCCNLFVFCFLLGEGGILSFFNLWFCTICIFRFQLHFLNMFFYRVNIASNPSDFEDIIFHMSSVFKNQKYRTALLNLSLL